MTRILIGNNGYHPPKISALHHFAPEFVSFDSVSAKAASDLAKQIIGKAVVDRLVNVIQRKVKIARDQ